MATNKTFQIACMLNKAKSYPNLLQDPMKLEAVLDQLSNLYQGIKPASKINLLIR